MAFSLDMAKPPVFVFKPPQDSSKPAGAAQKNYQPRANFFSLCLMPIAPIMPHAWRNAAEPAYQLGKGGDLRRPSVK
jgi:hypothetical protein